MGFLGNRMPDREERVHEFFFKAAGKRVIREHACSGRAARVETILQESLGGR